MKPAIVIASLLIGLAPPASAGWLEDLFTKPVTDAVESEKDQAEKEVQSATREEIAAARDDLLSPVTGAIRGARQTLGCMLRRNCPTESQASAPAVSAPPPAPSRADDASDDL